MRPLARRCWTVAPASYQPRVLFTILTTESMTGTSISNDAMPFLSAHSGVHRVNHFLQLYARARRAPIPDDGAG